VATIPANPPVKSAPPSHRPNGNGKPQLVFGEIFRFAYETFCSNKVRFVLTALGMVIGTASLILVVTIGLTGKQYILSQIQAIGSNMVYAYYEGGTTIGGTGGSTDYLTLADMNAVRQQVPGIIFSSPMVEFHDRIGIPGGKERDILCLGVNAEYRWVRNLDVQAGRFFDDGDTMARNKVALITVKLAQTLYGGQDNAICQELKISGLFFVIAGTFREKVETFGQSEIADDTILVPHTVARYFTGTDAIKQLFFSVADANDVPHATEEIRQVLKGRHRAESNYRVDNLSQLLDVAAKTANALTAVLLLIAMVTLVVSGVGIMNIMLATVSSRIREIGVRKAVGATNREIKFQFLAEAIFISLIGGFVGTVICLALPISVRWFTDYRIPISGLSIIISLLVSSLVGVIFGTVPASRAAGLDPVESLRYE